MKAENIDQYISLFPEETKAMLQKIREIITKTVPEAEETISYAIPAFKMKKGYLVYFAGFKNHVSVYPVPNGDKAYKESIAPFRTGKGTLQFPIGSKLPVAVITKTVKLLLAANKERNTAKN